ncbi:hypothetical protein [Streptomyces spiralis]
MPGHTVTTTLAHGVGSAAQRAAAQAARALADATGDTQFVGDFLCVNVSEPASTAGTPPRRRGSATGR